MTGRAVLLTFCSVAAIGCGARSTRPGGGPTLVRVEVCRVVSTPDGRDVDDAPATVVLVVEGPRPHRTHLGRVLSHCWQEPPAASDEVGRAVCEDPFVDHRTLVRLRRPTSRSVIVEIEDVGVSGAPATPRKRETVEIEPATRVALRVRGACGQ